MKAIGNVFGLLGAALLFVTPFLLIIALAVGYVINIVKITSIWAGELGVELMVRLIGTIFVPLGGIIGYF